MTGEGETVEPASTAQALRVFLNYRREDTGGQAGRLFDGLVGTSGDTVVFRDIDRIAPGVDFVEVIDDALDSCDVVLALIGRRWSDITDAHGRRRLDDDDDFVRLELEKALGRRDVRVIPVLIDGAAMPPSGALPEGLRSLARRQAFELSDRRWKYDLSMLVETLEQIAKLKAEQVLAEQAATAAAERERLEQQRLQADRLEAERLAAERLAAKSLAAERAEADQSLEAERRERERAEAARREAERAEAKRREAERREAKRLEDERRAAEQAAATRLEAERRAAARLEAEQRKQSERDRKAGARPAGSAMPRRRRMLLLAVGGAVVALLVSGVAVIALSGGDPQTARAVPQVAADRLGVLAGSQRYSFPIGALLKNDKGDGLRMVGVSGGSALHGALRLDGQRVRYAPDGGYGGPFAFTYTVRDSDGDLAVGTASGRVKGLSAQQRNLVALVPPAARASCLAGRSAGELRCDVPVGGLLVRRYATKAAAEAALASRFGAAEGSCAAGPATGQWNWPGSSLRGRYGCGISGGRPALGWTYPAPARATALAVVTGAPGVPLKRLDTWFFEQARLPKPA